MVRAIVSPQIRFQSASALVSGGIGKRGGEFFSETWFQSASALVSGGIQTITAISPSSKWFQSASALVSGGISAPRELRREVAGFNPPPLS